MNASTLPPLLDALQAAKVERAELPTSQPLSEETRKRIDRSLQLDVDHIQRRDRAWDDALAGRS